MEAKRLLVHRHRTLHYNIITLPILTDHSRLRNNVHLIQNKRRLFTYSMHRRRGLIIISYIYNYVQFVSCTISIII